MRLSSRRQPLLPCPPVFCDLAVLGAVGGGLASSAHEWLLQRLGAVIAQRVIAAVALGRCVLRPWHLVSLGSLVLLVKRQAARANGLADEGREVFHIYQLLPEQRRQECSFPAVFESFEI